jgi:hypothetical protein
VVVAGEDMEAEAFAAAAAAVEDFAAAAAVEDFAAEAAGCAHLR